jgi:hypothetical protein
MVGEDDYNWDQSRHLHDQGKLSKEITFVVLLNSLFICWQKTNFYLP